PFPRAQELVNVEGIAATAAAHHHEGPMKARRDVRIALLCEVQLFDGCTDAQLERIARIADEIAVPAGYVLVYEGDWGHEVFVVAGGEARGTGRGRAPAVLGGGAGSGERG